jgi:predicted PurR-regulated permease PerM
VGNANRPNGSAKTASLLIVLIVVAVFYFARTIFVPLALSILLSFMLAPLVIRLRRWGLGRIPAAIMVVLVAFAILGVIGAVMASQLADLAHKLPEYQHNVHEKVESIRNSGGRLVKRLSGEVQRFSDTLTPPPAATAQNQPPEERPVPVEIRRAAFSPVDLVQKILGSIVNVALMAAIVIVFVVFMLIEQDDLRDRLIRLAGSRQVSLTTNVLDDAASRVSRYLLAQFVVNIAYGIITGTVLFFIHVPNPLLWAMLAALFRYIPYLGIWLAALMPASVAFAVRPGWVDVPVVFGVYLGVDLLIYNFVEPLLYGSSTGLSPLAVLVAAVFWTWLWGPVGLLLATPLTVCAVVIARYVPNLSFLHVLLSDEPVLPPETRFYQRMLAMDSDGAAQVSEEFLKGKSLEELYDVVIIPALRLAEEDRHRGKLDETKERFLFENARILLEELAERAQDLADGNSESKGGLLARTTDSPKLTLESAGPVAILCVPARDAADELAAFMLKQLLQKRGLGAKSLPSGGVINELIDAVDQSRPKVVCITAVPPFSSMHTRYLCRRLRNQFKEPGLVVAFLSENEFVGSNPTQAFPAADETVSSLRQAMAKMARLAQTADESSLLEAVVGP